MPQESPSVPHLRESEVTENKKMLPIFERLLCAKHRVTHATYSTKFNPNNTTLKEVLLFSL